MNKIAVLLIVCLAVVLAGCAPKGDGASGGAGATVIAADDPDEALDESTAEEEVEADSAQDEAAEDGKAAESKERAAERRIRGRRARRRTAGATPRWQPEPTSRWPQ